MNNTTIIMAGAFMALASAAYAADDNAVKPYVGLNLSTIKANYENDPTLGIDGSDLFDDRLNGLAPYVGLQITPRIALELGYLRSQEGKKDNVLGTAVDSKIRLSGLTADVVGNLPISADGQTAVLGSAGLVRYTGKISATDGVTTVSTDDADVGFRLGAGVQHQLNDTWGARAMVHYTKVDFDDSVKNLVSASIGLNYKF